MVVVFPEQCKEGLAKSRNTTDKGNFRGDRELHFGRIEFEIYRKTTPELSSRLSSVTQYNPIGCDR